MEAYPEDYVAHNLPLVWLSGLGPSEASGEPSGRSRTLLFEGGFRIRTDAPPLTDAYSEQLLEAFFAADSTTAPWNSKPASDKDDGARFRIKQAGRTYTLPPRKAPPPPHSPRLAPANDGDTPPQPLIIHSTISPLTPSSPLFPDGIVTPLWITKHQSLLPAIIVSFFTLTSNPTTASLDDNRMKTEICNIRSALTYTNYKAKLVVVLVGETGVGSVSEIDERLVAIRRATSLDTKSLFFLPPSLPLLEIADFVQNLLSAQYNFCIEYYRDLSKHARRKRSRGIVPAPTVPPATGTSQTLPLQGWNVRYEFKLGVFAEMRQEMDAAGRNYDTAYETLFGPELLETIASWSPRFNEARLLADAIAIRIIRCQLWNGNTTAAVRTWLSHRDRIQDLVNRRGKGTENYGWEAWKATWSKSMAQVIERVQIPAFLPRDVAEAPNKKTGSIFVLPEKAIPVGERISPWEQLHHEGYWLDVSRKHTQMRRVLALQIPEEDRTPPGQSPASVIANKTHLYDTYLTLEPFAEYPLGDKSGYDYTSDIAKSLQSAILRFSQQGQLRAKERLELEWARMHVLAGSWVDAANVLRVLWQRRIWRQSGWWKLLETVGWALRDCSIRSEDAESIIRVDWELGNKVFTVQNGHHYNLHESLNGIVMPNPKPEVVIRAEDALSSISPTFAFAASEGNVGEPLKAQLCLRSLCRPGAGAIRLSEIKIVFEGSLRPIRLLADKGIARSDETPKTRILDVDLHDLSMSTDSSNIHSSAGSHGFLIWSTDLNLEATQITTYNLILTPREAGDVKIASITAMIDEERFNLAFVVSEQDETETVWWDSKDGQPFPRRIGRDRDATMVKVLSKPPKVHMVMTNYQKTYYTNEEVVFDLEFRNDEEEQAILSVTARLMSLSGRVQNIAKIKWGAPEAPTPDGNSEINESSFSLPNRSIGSIEKSGSHLVKVIMTDAIDPLDYELEVVARYHLQSDPETPLSKVQTFHLTFIRPFEANYEFLSRLDPKAWPNFFDISSAAVLAESSSKEQKIAAIGLSQQYAVVARAYSFAKDPLIIEQVGLMVQSVAGGAVCRVSPPLWKNTKLPNDDAIENGPRKFVPGETQEYEFTIEVQKMALADRQSVGLELALEMRWRRVESESITTTTLEIPRFMAPAAEPRVLLTAIAASTSSITGLRHLRYTFENPSMHFLTFNITMDSSEDFAFSGPKAASISLVPLSRHHVNYRILSSKSSEWVRIGLGVVDAYYGQTLKVQAASEGVKSDLDPKKHNVFVWID